MSGAPLNPWLSTSRQCWICRNGAPSRLTTETTFARWHTREASKTHTLFPDSSQHTSARCLPRAVDRSDGQHFQATHETFRLPTTSFSNYSLRMKSSTDGFSSLERKSAFRACLPESAGWVMASAHCSESE